jgi:hypothetical protein
MSLPVFQQYQHAFTDYLRNPGKSRLPAGVAARGMNVYAEIVSTNFDETLSACFPVAKSVLGKRAWAMLIGAFVAEHRCASPLFRRIPEGFVTYLQTAPLAGAFPPFLASLAHYEWVELALALSDAMPPLDCQPGGDLLEGVPVIAPAHQLLRYDYPVHRISPRYKPTQPDTQPTHILTFRRPDHEVKFIVLNAMSARLLQCVQQGMTGAAAMSCLASQLPHLPQETVRQGGWAVLEQLRAEQAIWGAKRS